MRHIAWNGAWPCLEESFADSSYLSSEQTPARSSCAPISRSLRTALLRLSQGRQHRSNNPDRLAVASSSHSRERRILLTTCAAPPWADGCSPNQDAGFSHLAFYVCMYLPKYLQRTRQLGPKNVPRGDPGHNYLRYARRRWNGSHSYQVFPELQCKHSRTPARPPHLKFALCTDPQHFPPCGCRCSALRLPLVLGPAAAMVRSLPSRRANPIYKMPGSHDAFSGRARFN
jgi:hypothetical protein